MAASVKKPPSSYQAAYRFGLPAYDLMKSISYLNVDSKVYPGMRQEILNETRKAEVWRDVIVYLQGL